MSKNMLQFYIMWSLQIMKLLITKLSIAFSLYNFL
jgi:hypothetical protein